VLADAFGPWKLPARDEVQEELSVARDPKGIIRAALPAAASRLIRPPSAHSHVAGYADSSESRLSGT
jgi:hypothetical protein